MAGLLYRLAAEIPAEDRAFIIENLGALAQYEPPLPIFNRLESIYIKHLLGGDPSGSYSRSCGACVKTMSARLKDVSARWKAGL